MMGFWAVENRIPAQKISKYFIFKIKVEYCGDKSKEKFLEDKIMYLECVDFDNLTVYLNFLMLNPSKRITNPKLFSLGIAY